MHPDLPPQLTAPVGRFEVTFEAPDDLLSLGVELSDEEAAAEHAAFLDARLAETASGQVRGQALAQLADARARLAASDVRYLAVASTALDEQWVFCLFGVSVAGFAHSPDFAPSDMLAAALRHQYGQDRCLVEQFETNHGPAVGARRLDVLPVPAETRQSAQAEHIDTGVSQAIVIFPDLEVAGVVSGYCLNPDHLDLTTVLVARIAHTLRITSAETQAG